MKSKLTVLGLCLFIFNLQAAVAQANPCRRSRSANVSRSTNGSNALRRRARRDRRRCIELQGHSLCRGSRR